MSETDKPVTDKPAGNYITQAWLVIILALLYGGALAGVQLGLGPIIQENQFLETQQEMPGLFVDPETETTDVVAGKPVTIAIDETTSRTVYAAHDADKNLKGWVIQDSGQGFADRITVLIALDANLDTITGLFVLDQKETPGLGNFIREKYFLERFQGKQTAEPLEVVTSTASGQQIEALTGATISSVAVADIVNNAVATFREPILQQKAEIEQQLQNEKDP